MNTPIVAIATSTATDAALSVIRVSGDGCHAAVERCIRRKGAWIDLATVESRSVGLYEFVDPACGDAIDVVTIILYRAPRSYTGEDMAEIICHGGRGVTRQIFLKLVEAGCSPAGAGDFTRRAFLNGKLDLAQAEAVSAATTAASLVGARAAATALSGETSARIRRMSDQLVEILSLLEANLDLSEEGIDVVDPNRILNILRETDASLSELLLHADRSVILAGALRVALVGKPNVGKSTLLNRLLGSDRAIVSDMPGTTRDAIEGRAEIGGLPFEFVDTAGIRPTSDNIETEGIERTRRAARNSHLVLHVLDAASIGPEDACIARDISHEIPRILVINKIDLTRPSREALAPFLSNGFASCAVVETVGTRPDGTDALRSALVEHGRAILGETADAPVWISARQAECLRRAKTAVERARRASIDIGMTEEFLSADIREALDALADFAGRKTADDVLDRIFQNFCVGK